MRVLTLAAVAVAVTVGASSDDSIAAADLDTALSLGDECAGDDESCALNELQLRAGRQSKEQAAESAKWSIWPWNWFRGSGPAKGPGSSGHGLEHPVYCDQAAWKDTPICTGNATCKCQGYCASSDKDWWGTDPNCCACDGVTASPAPSSAPPSGDTGASGTHPAYCQFLPSTTALPWCQADNGCRCQAYCKQSVAPTSWGWDPNCCGCSVASLVAEAVSQRSDSRALVHPIYCRSAQAALSPWCQGENTCSCQQYCTLAVPPANWGWDPNCCLCNGSSAVSAEPPPASESPLPAPSPEEGAVTYGGLTHPIYCLTSPLGVYSPYCLGANTCHCVPYCKLTVLPAMWGYDPSCCACTTSAGTPAAPVGGPPVAVGGDGPLSHPLYCQGLKTAGIFSPWCAGTNTCACRSFCALTSLPSSWGWDPQCCGCSANATSPVAAPTPSGAPGGPAETVPAPAPAPAQGSGVEPRAPHRYPTYCASVPPDTTLPWCSGAPSCKCVLYCKASVMPANWGVDPNCCGCDAGSDDDGARPGEAPPPATGRNTSANVTYGPLTHPKYCDNIPPGAPSVTWCKGENTCECEDYCTLSVAPSNWGWDPNCCGCSTAEINEEVKSMDEVEPAIYMSGSSAEAKLGAANEVESSTAAPAMASAPPKAELGDANAVESSTAAPAKESAPPKASLVAARREVPGYCAYIGEAAKPEACKTGKGGCACQGFCKEYVPATSWKFNPQCCGCA